MEEHRIEVQKPGKLRYNRFDMETPRSATQKPPRDIDEECAKSEEIKCDWVDVLVVVFVSSIVLIIMATLTVVPIIMGSLIVRGTFDHTVYRSCNLTQQTAEADQCPQNWCQDSDGYPIPGCDVMYYNCTHYSCVFTLLYKNVNYTIGTGGYNPCQPTVACSFDRRKVSKTLNVNGSGVKNPDRGFGIFLIVSGATVLLIAIAVFSCVKWGRCSSDTVPKRRRYY